MYGGEEKFVHGNRRPAADVRYHDMISYSVPTHCLQEATQMYDIDGETSAKKTDNFEVKISFLQIYLMAIRKPD